MGKVALVAKITHVPSMYLSELDGPRKGTRQDAIDGHIEIGRRYLADGERTSTAPEIQESPAAEAVSEDRRDDIDDAESGQVLAPQQALLGTPTRDLLQTRAATGRERSPPGGRCEVLQPDQVGQVLLARRDQRQPLGADQPPGHRH